MTAAVQSAMSNALQHVPLINGATAGASRQVKPAPDELLCMALDSVF